MARIAAVMARPRLRSFCILSAPTMIKTPTAMPISLSIKPAVPLNYLDQAHRVGIHGIHGRDVRPAMALENRAESKQSDVQDRRDDQRDGRPVDQLQARRARASGASRRWRRDRRGSGRGRGDAGGCAGKRSEKSAYWRERLPADFAHFFGHGFVIRPPIFDPLLDLVDRYGTVLLPISSEDFEHGRHLGGGGQYGKA